MTSREREQSGGVSVRGLVSSVAVLSNPRDRPLEALLKSAFQCRRLSVHLGGGRCAECVGPAHSVTQPVNQKNRRVSDRGVEGLKLTDERHAVPVPAGEALLEMI